MSMLPAAQIRSMFSSLNEELRAQDVIGEVGICGGAVMCLVFNARASTKDVDAIFEPTQEIRAAAAIVARKFSVGEDWLNDAAKGYFLANTPRQEVLQYSNLRVWAPTAEYMLAMKCVSARFDSYDRDDAQFLIQHLELDSVDAIFEVVSQFYPRDKVPAKTGFLIEELLGE
jgi:hypothetical protein